MLYYLYFVYLNLTPNAGQTKRLANVKKLFTPTKEVTKRKAKYLSMFGKMLI